MRRLLMSLVLYHPGHSLGVVLTLAAGFVVAISASSLVSAFFLRPLPVDDLDRLVRLRETQYGEDGSVRDVKSLSAATWRLWRERATVFEDVAAATADARSLTALELPERVQGALVTPNFFSVLGLQANLGRTFLAEESPDDATVVVSTNLWRRIFDGSEDAIGKDLELDGQRLRVIGVLPRGVLHPYSADYWIVLDPGEEMFRPGGNYLYAPARLADGVTREEAELAMRSVAAELREEAGEITRAEGALLRPLREEILGDLGPVLALIAGAASFVLLLSIVSVVNLILARSVRDRRQTAIRRALGAGGWSLLLDSGARHAALVLLAAGIGAAATFALLPNLYGIAGLAAIDEFDSEPRLDLGTLGLVLALALAVTLFLSLVEAWRRSRNEVAPTLLAGGRTASESGGVRRLMTGLAVVQLAVGFALVGGAAVVVSDYRSLFERDTGYRIDDRVLFDVTFPAPRYPEMENRIRAVQAIEEELASRPGVDRVGASTATPDYPGSWGGAFRVPGVDAPEPPGYFLTNHRLVTAGYFEALGIPLLRGRTFTAAEMADPGSRSLVVSRGFARELFGTYNALGREVVRTTAQGEVRDRRVIVGVVGEVEEASASDFWQVTHAWYLPLSAGTDYDLGGVTFVVEAPKATAGLFESIRRAVLAVDGSMAASRLAWMEDRLREIHSRNQLSAVLYSLFGAISLAVAGLGLFSLQSFVVSARLRELSIRLALGASPMGLLRMVLREGLGLTLLALAIGAPLLWAAVRLYRSFVVAEGPPDVLSLAVAALVLGLTSLVATLLPGLRAVQVQPRGVLACE